jgi:hypothetical protein
VTRLIVSILLAVMLCTAALAGDADVTVYVTKTGEKYHLGDCRYLKKSKIKTNLKWAKANDYDPCKVCEPPT